MKALALFALLTLTGTGCTFVSNDRVFPKLTWYWTAEAKQQRASNARHKSEEEAYKKSQQNQTKQTP